jgi:hypothetical protein
LSGGRLTPRVHGLSFGGGIGTSSFPILDDTPQCLDIPLILPGIVFRGEPLPPYQVLALAGFTPMCHDPVHLERIWGQTPFERDKSELRHWNPVQELSARGVT